MELGFNGTIVGRACENPKQRLKRAQWWFKQMRRAVDCAMDWKPSPNARSEQVHMKLASRW